MYEILQNKFCKKKEKKNNFGLILWQLNDNSNLFPGLIALTREEK